MLKRTNSDLVFPIDEVAALGENAVDFKRVRLAASADVAMLTVHHHRRQGVCGRCYEVRCRSGNVKWDYNCPTWYAQQGVAFTMHDASSSSLGAPALRRSTEQLGGKLQGDVAPGAHHSFTTSRLLRLTQLAVRRCANRLDGFQESQLSRVPGRAFSPLRGPR